MGYDCGMNTTTLADALKSAARESGLTSYALGKSAGVHPTQIDRWLSGERSVSLDTASKIAGVLGVQVSVPKNKSKKSISAS